MISNNMAQNQMINDQLPKGFVNAMRTLFRIMDDQNTGYVKYSDIKERWQDDGNQGLPKGVLDSLKKVALPDGLLTFDRFCTGLKLCLLSIQNEGTSNRPISAPSATDNPLKTSWTSPNTAAIRPNNAISQQRTSSMPQLIDRKDFNPENLETRGNNYDSKTIKPFGPPKPPRIGANIEPRLDSDERIINTQSDKAEIKAALQNWQVGMMMNEEKALDKKKMNYNVGDLRNSLRPQPIDEKPVDAANPHGIAHKKTVTRRREPRRHTLQNGIDYNMMKRMKHVEQEKDILLQGLGAVDKTRNWYLKQIAATQEKLKHLGSMGAHVEPWTETQQERLELRRASILEVNRHLVTLISSWERGNLPLYMNLAFLNTSSSSQDVLCRLKHQNYRLNEEVNKKNLKIASLEQEKDNLMRELYNNRQAGMIQSRRSTMIHEQQQTFII